MNERNCLSCGEPIKPDWKFCPKCGWVVPAADVFENFEEGCKMYTKYNGDTPVAYLYGPEWRAMELMIEDNKSFDMKIFLDFMKVYHSEEFEQVIRCANEINSRKRLEAEQTS